MARSLLEFTGTVVELEKELIPKLRKARIVSEDSSMIVEMDLHEDLVVYEKGRRLKIGIFDGVPDYRDGIDLVMSAYHVSKRETGEREEHLFSAGGLLFKISLPKNVLNVAPLQKVYIKVEEKQE